MDLGEQNQTIGSPNPQVPMPLYPTRWSEAICRWRSALAVLVVTAVVAGIYYVEVKGEQRSAFNRWQPMVRELMAGEDVYHRHAFPTPPIMGMILYPFVLLTGKWAMTGWFAVKVVLTAIAFLWMLRMVDSQENPLPIWLALLTLLLVAKPVLGDLLHGNVNLWILFLVVACLVAYRCGRDVLCGTALSLAIACKLTPALLLVYFAGKGAWRVVTACMCGLLLWLFVVPGSILGLQRNVTLLQGWYETMVRPYLVEGRVETEQINQSVPGLFYRLTTPSLAIKPDDGRPPVSVNLARLSSEAARTLLRCLIVAILLVLAYGCRASIRLRQSSTFLHQAGLVLIAMLLISERSWKHHYVILLPSFVVLAATAYSTGQTGWQRRFAKVLWGLLGLSGLAMALASKDLVRPFLGVDGSKLAQAYGVYVWAAGLLFMAHLLCLRLSLSKG